MTDWLTYRYPRTLAEACARHPCDGEDAIAIHGPYRREWTDERAFAAALLLCLAAIAVGVLRGLGLLEMG